MNGQQDAYRYRELTVTDGLPNATVIDIAQDSAGYIWLATNHGISRYDGNRFRNYFPARTLDPETPTRELPSLHVGPGGTVWVGYLQAKTKIFRYDGQRDTFLAYPEHLPGAVPAALANNGVWGGLYENTAGQLWVATGSEGLYRLPATDRGVDSSDWRHYLPRPRDERSLPTKFLSKGLWEDGKTGYLWIATENGLACYRPEEDDFRTYRWSDRPVGNEIMGFLPDPAAGCLWLGSLYGMLRFDLATATVRMLPLPAAPAGDGRLITSPKALDVAGNVWATVGSFPAARLWLLDPTTESWSAAVGEQANERDALPGANAILRARDGRLWSGGFRRGVQVIEPTPGANVVRPLLPAPTDGTEPLRPSSITAFAYAGADRLFLGTTDRGVWRWDRTENTLTAVVMPGIELRGPHPRIWDLKRDPRGETLVALTAKAGYRLPLAGGRATVLRPFPDQPGYGIHNRARFFTDRLWLACYGSGLALFSADGTVPERRYFSNAAAAPLPQPAYPFGSISDLQPGPVRGQLWLATTYNGLLEWREATSAFRHYPMSRTIRRLYPAPDGTVWLATDTGLKRFDPVREQMMELSPDLATGIRVPRSLIPDGAGNLWVAAENGLTAVDPLTGEVRYRLHASTWMPPGENWYAADMFGYRHPPSGELFFANAHGLFVVDPAALTFDTTAPGLRLQQLEVNRRALALPKSGETTVTLRHHENDLRFRVAALHYKAPDRNRLWYRLDHFDDDFRSARPGETVEYPNLPPGDYRLLARATSSDGVTGPERILTTLRIRPPWYANAWAYLCYLLAVIGLVVAVVHQLARRRQREAERRFREEMDRAKTRLFTNISHEFRTPLTLILGEASLLAGKTNGQAVTHLGRIRRSGQRLLWLVNQLLDLAQADSGFLRLEPRRADIIPFLRFSLQSFESLAAPRGIELRFAASTDRLVMDFDPERLQRVMSNLLLNAVRFTPDGGWIALGVSTPAGEAGRQLQLRVTDSGPGIPAAELPLVFDRFHRATRQRGGAGIGLALSKELVTLMGGTIAAANASPGGAAFTLRLPLTEVAPLAAATDYLAPDLPGHPPGPDPAPAAAPNGEQLPRVLVVEDNDDLRPFLRACLADRYRLTLARDGQEGMDLAREQPFDLIVSDVMMPRMDGFQFCQALREDPATSHLPVLLLTARVDLASRLEGFSRGADAYLAKPFDPDLLRVRCAQLLTQQVRLRAHYLQLLREATPTQATDDTPEHSFVLRARAVVEAHLDGADFGVDDLARALHLSRSQLHRKLRQLTGLSTSRFIRHIRLRHAETLLADASRNIAEVAYDCGFRDPDYFARVFREHYDQSPSDFRRSANGQNGRSKG